MLLTSCSRFGSLGSKGFDYGLQLENMIHIPGVRGRELVGVIWCRYRSCSWEGGLKGGKSGGCVIGGNVDLIPCCSRLFGV